VQDDGQVTREERILEYCATPRTRKEVQKYAGINNRDYFRLKILKLLLESGKLKMTIPDKPNSRNQKYVRA
jgi:ATP-dependent DNA helicase RecG